MAKRAKKASAPKGTVAAASLAAGSSGAVGEGISSKAIEHAMSTATTDALQRGITDDAAIRDIKLAARARVKAHASAGLIEDEKQREHVINGIDKDYGQLVDSFAKAAEKRRAADRKS